ncbi:Gfo/Idh/MocA family protein [Labrys okinawensis]|uniref:Gfo/Idh/MocA family protein n=1 Tax=Labrys okinawensis TaxID=346911 RepID=UPI0039BCB6BC
MKFRIGIIGSGNVSLQYLRNAPLFREVEITACADVNADFARQRADQFGLRAFDVDTLLRDANIDAVLNLTIPAAHFEISMRALEAGKHVYTEKPLCFTLDQGRALVEIANAKGLALGCAPDTFLGPAGRLLRRQIDVGVIGKIVLGTAYVMSPGPEYHHPNPYFHFQRGGGPLLDMGPYYLTMLVNLMGPVRRVLGMAKKGRDSRTVKAEGPMNGSPIAVDTETSVLSLLEFQNGALVTLGASWDVFRHSNEPIELHGTQGSLRLPDPDTFGGIVALSDQGMEWQESHTAGELLGQFNWPIESPNRANYRMLGLADMARAIAQGRKPRASGELALHVLEVLHAILRASETGNAEIIAGNVQQPEALTEQEVRSYLA